MSLARLTSLSTQTLSLLLERQRLASMGQPPPAAHTQQVARNLAQLRTGVLELERTEGAHTEAAELLRNQFTRMRDMLGEEKTLVEPLPTVEKERSEPEREPSAQFPSQEPSSKTPFVPYSDEPPPSPDIEPTAVLQQQRVLMDEQDAHLDNLSHSIGRQRDISIQIGDELEVHTGLLEDLDHGLDHTGDRLTGARRRLERFSRGVKGNWSTYIIALLILVLLLLIIVFKT